MEKLEFHEALVEAMKRLLRPEVVVTPWLPRDEAQKWSGVVLYRATRTGMVTLAVQFKWSKIEEMIGKGILDMWVKETLYVAHCELEKA